MTRIKTVLGRLDRRREDGERGFSLIELIIVIVILGVLVAIAIPVYNNIQDKAKTNAIKTAAANGASQAVSALANDSSVTKTTLNGTGTGSLSNLVSGDVKLVQVANTVAITTDNLCVVAADNATLASASKTSYAGPGAKSDGTGCNSGV